MTIHMSLDNAEHAFLREHLLAHYCHCRLALLGRHVGNTLILSASSRTQCAQAVRHSPNAVLVGDEHSSVTPRQSIRRIQSFHVALNPFGLAIAILIPQEREMTF